MNIIYQGRTKQIEKGLTVKEALEEEIKNNKGKCYLYIDNKNVVGLIMGIIPKYDENGELEGHHIYSAKMLVRRDEDGKLYLYDFVRTKKETSSPLRQ